MDSGQGQDESEQVGPPGRPRWASHPAPPPAGPPTPKAVLTNPEGGPPGKSHPSPPLSSLNGGKQVDAHRSRLHGPHPQS